MITSIWQVGEPGAENEAELKKYCAKSRDMVEEAVRVGARSIAFPAISTGVYGYPKAPAAQVAVAAVRAALAAHAGAIDEVVFCCFSEDDWRTLQAALQPG